MDKYNYMCIPCRFTSKYGGFCPKCRVPMMGLYDYRPPKKRDDDGWKKLFLYVSMRDSNLDLCTWWCCRPKHGPTLSQYKSQIRQRLAHRSSQRKRAIRVGVSDV